MSEEINEVKKSGEKKPNKCTIDLSRLCNCISIVIYVDQVGHRFEDLDIPTSTKILEEAINKMCEVPGYKVVGVVHYKDAHSDGFQDVADKVHAHILIISNVRCRCTKIIKDFSDIILFDEEKDASLIDHELKFINLKKNQEKIMYVYFAHDTAGAINDGKVYYGYDTIITNISEEELQDWRTWYEQHERGVEYNKGHRNSRERVMLLMRDFYNVGLNGNSYREQEKQLVFEDLCNSSLCSELKKIYDKGFDIYREKRQYLTRCCIFITGQANIGKSFNAYNILEEMGERPFLVSKEAGTGATDDLDVRQSIIYDDYYPSAVMKLADDYACNVYRRNSCNGLFNGNYLVIISNFKFEQFFEYLTKDSKVDLTALKSRFFIAEIGECYPGKMIYETKNNCERGDAVTKRNMYVKFMDLLLDRINEYVYR